MASQLNRLAAILQSRVLSADRKPFLQNGFRTFNVMRINCFVDRGNQGIDAQSIADFNLRQRCMFVTRREGQHAEHSPSFWVGRTNFDNLPPVVDRAFEPPKTRGNSPTSSAEFDIAG